MINRVPLTKPPDALVDRAQEIVTKFGYGGQVRSTAASMGWTLNWARYVGATSTDPNRWAALNTPRPLSLYLWYRTSPQLLFPYGTENRVDAGNPPVNLQRMTLTLVDTAGRLAQFTAVPGEYLTGTAGSTDWARVFDAAALPMPSFTPVAPALLPPFYADERRAWEGRLPERPDLTVHVEAAAFHGHPTYFALTGPWSRSASAAAPSFARRYNAVMSQITAVVMPGLMLVGVLLARRNVKLGRGDRRGAFRAAAALFLLLMTAWLLGDRHVPVFGIEMAMLFSAVGQALFGGAILWLSYLGLEPYVRRFAPDSLIGWTRLLAGSWRDPRVGRDVLIGVSAGVLMTIIVGSHNLIPVLAGKPELIPLPHDPGIYLKFRYPFAQMFDRAQEALSAAMLSIAGYTAVYILLKRRLWAAVFVVILYTPVATNGLFISETPLLDTAVGFAIITVFVTVIARVGLLATVALLMTHFVLLRAAVTTDLSSWRFATGFVPLGTIVACGFLSAAIAAGRFQTRAAAHFR